MAFLQVQTSAQVSGTSNPLDILINPTTQGNIVVVNIAGSIIVTSVTDDVGNVYALAGTLTNVSLRTYQYYAVQVIGGATVIHINNSTNVGATAGADEYSGNAATNAAAFDVMTFGGGASGTSLIAPTLTPAATGELIVETGGLSLAKTWTNGVGYTNYNGNGSEPTQVRSQYKLSGGASEIGDWTIDTSARWSVILVAYKGLSLGRSFGVING